MTHAILPTRCLLVFVCTFLLLPFMGCNGDDIMPLPPGTDHFESIAELTITLNRNDELGIPAFEETIVFRSSSLPEAEVPFSFPDAEVERQGQGQVRPANPCAKPETTDDRYP